MDTQLQFPQMPPPTPPMPSWPSFVDSAHQFIESTCRQALRLIRLSNGDIARLNILKGTIETECLPTLEHLEVFGLQPDYVDLVLVYLANTIVQLEIAISNLKDR